MSSTVAAPPLAGPSQANADVELAQQQSPPPLSQRIGGRLAALMPSQRRPRAQDAEQGDEQPVPQHAREGSARSALSQRLATLRGQDRETTRNTTQADIEARAAPRGPTRREREEASSLFGPNLAVYFSSGSVSSGAAPSASAAAASAPVAGAAPAAPATGEEELASTDSTAVANATARKARLGSRGRARGASLSGIGSQLSLPLDGGESVTSLPLGSMPHPLDGSAAPASARAEGVDDVVAMAEGIEIDTLRKWIERSIDGGALEVHPGETTNGAPSSTASGAPPAICSTLQSYVNLKRNTVKLGLEPVAGTSAAPASPIAAQPFMPEPLTPVVGEDALGSLRHAPSLGNISLMQGAPGGHAGLQLPHGAAGPLPPSSHTLYFEYDCAAPAASVQLFLRASRKHGSWNENSEASATSAGGAGYLAQRGPPPHVLGWPVHSARLRRGFGEPMRAALALHLQYYAPPKAAKRSAGAVDGEEEDEENLQEMPAETPGLNVQRQLGVPPTPAAAPAANPFNLPGATDASAAPATPAAVEPTGEETKEARLAREKLERETLKLAVVVEALDEDGRPLREPNLQTTYLRLTSLPARPRADAAAAEAEATPAVERVWTVQVEGQEAEIGPHRFQLQELYGLSTRPPAVKPAPVEGEGEDGDGEAAPMPMVDLDGTNGSECLICLSAPPTTLLLPCTHSLCLECAVQLRESVKAMRETERRRGRTPRRKYNCPACRRAFTSMLHLSAADEKTMAQTST
ncbi:hypothetical protein FA09DRAFT_343144 [Tilletiopsis washingtonensis]|uniref:RING-type domain-containing protein n=1 Tax=Tilletiopsis washingtonensis TaxID=58919 RepID=A0A316Z9N4_9BASI|nr:hypothetical protein FA09DRAFT_343144 [Tilletiopsis washingtonensis]PWN98507.1 hypothetical protein FA09DRAFT_343144 [Tilletiopsis washingtonensis]